MGALPEPLCMVRDPHCGATHGEGAAEPRKHRGGVVPANERQGLSRAGRGYPSLETPSMGEEAVLGASVHAGKGPGLFLGGEGPTSTLAMAPYCCAACPDLRLRPNHSDTPDAFSAANRGPGLPSHGRDAPRPSHSAPASHSFRVPVEPSRVTVAHSRVTVGYGDPMQPRGVTAEPSSACVEPYLHGRRAQRAQTADTKKGQAAGRRRRTRGQPKRRSQEVGTGAETTRGGALDESMFATLEREAQGMSLSGSSEPDRRAGEGSSAVAPGRSRAVPGSSAVEPGRSRVAPGSSRTVPSSSRVVPGSSAVAPGSSRTVPRSLRVAPGSSHSEPGSSQLLYEDLDLRILEQRLALLKIQRELAAIRCSRFAATLEASLAACPCPGATSYPPLGSLFSKSSTALPELDRAARKATASGAP